MAVTRASKKNRYDSEQSTHCWTAIFLSDIKRNTQIRFHARKREKNQLGTRHATRQKSAMKMVSDIAGRWLLTTRFRSRRWLLTKEDSYCHMKMVKKIVDY